MELYILAHSAKIYATELCILTQDTKIYAGKLNILTQGAKMNATELHALKLKRKIMMETNRKYYVDFPVA
jgi:hypothetical protein